MGIGHNSQLKLFSSSWKHSLSYGGELRCVRLGRGQRPLSCREPLHVVFKINRSRLKHRGLRSSQCFSLINRIIQRYSKRFFVKIEQISIQGDHIHLLVRAPRRSKFHYFFRVVAGQIAQRFEKEGMLSVTDTPKIIKPGTGLWKYRPFSRVVRGWKAYKTAKDYIQLNEMEAQGQIPYCKRSLKGLSEADRRILQSG